MNSGRIDNNTAATCISVAATSQSLGTDQGLGQIFCHFSFQYIKFKFKLILCSWSSTLCLPIELTSAPS